jgi:hypothetical protein
MSNLSNITDNEYRRNVACLNDEELFREIWVMEEHIKYLQKEDDQSAHRLSQLLRVAIEEKDRRAFNKGYI